ncbi:MAG: NUDIX hydrolase [Oscillospiraceae bacterium]|nr:NUDIX hydrolase [Oscillospiraceae bacterium]
MEQKDYIQWIRSKVGHERIILVFSGGCAFDKEGRVLLQRRGDSSQWGFPGGAIEIGETPEMAAVREFKEETGLDVKVVDLIGIYTDCDMEYPNGDKAQSIGIVYEMEAIGGQLKCDNFETVELKYFNLDEMPELFCKQHEETKNDLLKRRNEAMMQRKTF